MLFITISTPVNFLIEMQMCPGPDTLFLTFTLLFLFTLWDKILRWHFHLRRVINLKKMPDNRKMFIKYG